LLLSKDEKALIILWRIEDIRGKTLFGYYKNYKIGENKIRKLKKKLERMGYNPDAKITIG
jgi:Fe2+ transport system protein FeoA